MLVKTRELKGKLGRDVWGINKLRDGLRRTALALSSLADCGEEQRLQTHQENFGLLFVEDNIDIYRSYKIVATYVTSITLGCVSIIPRTL